MLEASTLSQVILLGAFPGLEPVGMGIFGSLRHACRASNYSGRQHSLSIELGELGPAVGARRGRRRADREPYPEKTGEEWQMVRTYAPDDIKVRRVRNVSCHGARSERPGPDGAVAAGPHRGPPLQGVELHTSPGRRWPGCAAKDLGDGFDVFGRHATKG